MMLVGNGEDDANNGSGRLLIRWDLHLKVEFPWLNKRVQST